MTEEERRQPVFSPRMTENSAGQPCYLVEYDEDLWNKYDKAGQEHCFETWAKKAKPMGAQFVVLRLIPDALFPSGDKTIPYVARSYPVDQETFNPVTVTVKLSAQIHADTWANALDGERMKLTAAARTQLGMAALGTVGCSYEICTREGKELKIIERGRL
jgi:hypothetical protein